MPPPASFVFVLKDRAYLRLRTPCKRKSHRTVTLFMKMSKRRLRYLGLHGVEVAK